MPNIDLNLVLPTLSDIYSVAIEKTADALTAIADDLASPIVPSMILVNTAFSFNGLPATNLGSVLLADGNTPTAPGSIYYHSGEFFAIDATGTVQLTALGQLNAASVGGIVGDYGGVNTAKVTMVAASGEFQFTENTGVWADVVCDDVVLKGASGSIRLGCDTGITTNKSVLFNDLPAAGVSVLVYDASTQRIVDAQNTRVSNTIKATNIDITGDYRHGDKVLTFNGAVIQGGGINITPLSKTLTGGQYYYPLAFRTGDRIKSITIAFIGNGTDAVSLFQAFKTSAAGVDTSLGSAGVTPTTSWGDTVFDITDVTLAAGETIYFLLTTTGTTVKIGNVRVTYDRP